MAKKKEQELTYLQEPIPSSTKKYQTTKLNWSGLNYEQTVDTGALSMEKNISTEKAPYLTPSPIPNNCITSQTLGVMDGFEHKIHSIHPFEGKIIVIWSQWNNSLTSEEKIKNNATFVTSIDTTEEKIKVYKSVLRSKYKITVNDGTTVQCEEIEGYENTLVPRSIVQFNVNTAPLNPLANDVTRKLVIFPDKKTMDYDIAIGSDADDTSFTLQNIEPETTDIDSNYVETKYESDELSRSVIFDEESEDDGEPFFKVLSVGNTHVKLQFGNISKYKLVGISKSTGFTSSTSEPRNIIFEFANDDGFSSAEVLITRLERDTTYSFIGYGMYEDEGFEFYESFSQNGTERKENISIVMNDEREFVRITTLDSEGTEPYYILDVDDVDESKLYRNTKTLDVYQFNEEKKKWRKVIIPTCPAIQYAVVHQSRVFGVGGSKVYASGFNDYTNWNLDTVDEYNESNAWCSSSQSNTKADGDFTGITTFQNSVLLFKKDNMQEVRNNKNPFRLLDIFNEGAVNNQSVQDVNGTLIFCTGEKVITYNGGNPRIISHPLGVKKFKDPISGTDGRCYFLYCLDESDNARLFVYDTYVGEWSERTVPLYEGNADSVVGFAHNDTGMYMACEHNGIYKLDTNTCTGQEWSFETDVMTNHTVDIKHLNKFQIYAEFQSASLKVSAIYDDKEPTEIYFGEKLDGIKPIRVLVRQSANYSLKLRFEGTGYMKLHSMNLITSSGGNLYV